MKTKMNGYFLLPALAGLALGLMAIQPAQAAFWFTTGAMGTARDYHTTTLLPNGKVLVAGGDSATLPYYLSGVELYDPATWSWTATGEMGVAREGHSATLLPNGKVLVAGGAYYDLDLDTDIYLSSAELYDPATGNWTPTGAMQTARRYHSATLLSNGKVLVAGGYNETDGHLSSTEVYDPATGNWTATGELGVGREGHSATLLPNGKVLVAGGVYADFDLGVFFFLSSAELYDPTTGMWTATGAMQTVRRWHTATLLQDGKVLVAGGYNGTHVYLSSVEVYDPDTGNWTASGGMGSARGGHSATLLPDGKVLIAGGGYFNSELRIFFYLSSAELYDPGTGKWTASGAMGDNRVQHSATLLPDGKVLVAGGYNSTDRYLSSVEVYGSASVPNPPAPTLVWADTLADGSFQFGFTSRAGALFEVLAATDLALPSNDWTVLGLVPEISPGQFQFTDPQAANIPRRFYRVRVR